jgi:NAD dependent epimerase/dehydratase family enzyme
MPAPAFVIRAILGEFGGVLLSSQRAMPDKLISKGYQFKFPKLPEALREIIY